MNQIFSCILTFYVFLHYPHPLQTFCSGNESQKVKQFAFKVKWMQALDVFCHYMTLLHDFSCIHLRLMRLKRFPVGKTWFLITIRDSFPLRSVRRRVGHAEKCRMSKNIWLFGSFFDQVPFKKLPPSHFPYRSLLTSDKSKN